jgi:hypothetical protein
MATFSSELGFGDEAGSALLGILGGVLLEQSEEDVGLVFIKGSGELGDGGGHLDSGQKNSLLSLEGDVFGPLDEAGEVSGGLDAVANSEIARSFLEERVHLLLHLLGALLSLHSFGHLFVGNNNNY